jgi:hypothetical protein
MTEFKAVSNPPTTTGAAPTAFRVAGFAAGAAFRYPPLMALHLAFTSLAALGEYLRFVALAMAVLQAWPHPPE